MDILWAGGVNNAMDFIQRMLGSSNATRLVDRFRVVDALKEVAALASPARVAIAWVLNRPAVSSVLIAGRKAEQLEG